MTKNSRNILLVEDDPVFARMARRMLENGPPNIRVTWHSTLKRGLAVLAEGGADMALLDLSLPDSAGLDTLKTVCGRFPGLPVVVMTGLSDEDTGIEALKLGAQDYLVKGQFDEKELKRVIRYAVERKVLLNDKEELITKLKEALTRVKQLTGLLPTCADCKKVRTPENKWVQMEVYISEHSDAVFSHGFCDACAAKRLREIGKEKARREKKDPDGGS